MHEHAIRHRLVALAVLVGTVVALSNVTVGHAGALGASPATGTTTTAFTVTWASAPPPAGYVVDVEVKRPGAAAYAPWQTGVTTKSATFVPNAGVGSYAFQARLHKTANGRASGWSAAKTITVG